MASKSFGVALIILVVAGLGNCAAVKQELTKINVRISHLQQKILNMQQSIVHLGYENRELRKELDNANNRTSELEIKLDLELSRSSSAITVNEIIVHFENENRELRKELDKANNRTSELEIKLDLAITDNGSKGSTVEEKIQNIEGVINLLVTDIDHLKSKPYSNTKKLEVTMRKALMRKAKAFLRKLNGTIRSKQEVATREINRFMARSNKSLERHIEAIGNLHNTTNEHEEAILEMTAKLGKIITAMGNTDTRISQNERLLTALSGNYSNLKIEDIGNLYNTTSEQEEAILVLATKLDKSITALGNNGIRISQTERLLAALSDCGSHKDIPNGDVSGDSFVGGTPVISCNSGYSQTGSAQCKAPVFWETDANCQKDCAELNVANGIANPSSDVPHDTEVTVVCDSGYTVVGNSTVMCNNGDFSGHPKCLKDCAELNVANSLANPAFVVPHGTEVTVVCDSGYTMVGNNTVMCNNGDFSGHPRCLKDCPHLNVTNGMANPASEVPHGTEVTLVCDSGYTIIGNNAVMCNNGDFSALPKCLKDCAVIHVANGMVTPETSVPHGTTVTVTCDSGYAAIGNKTAVCKNGSFSTVLSCGFSLTDMVVGSSSSFNVKIDEDYSTPLITGAEFLYDGRLILCDYYHNKRIKILSKNFTMIDSLELQSTPFDVSVVNSSTVIITLPFLEQLQYVHVVPHFKLSSNIQLNKWCWGVAVVADEIFTSCYISWNTYDGEIRVLDFGGTLKRRLGLRQDNSYMFAAPGCLTVSSNTGYIYVSDIYTDKVTCLSSAGEVIYQYGDRELDSSRDVYVDHAGNTIVCGEDSNNIHIITTSGKKHRILLTSSDGLDHPCSVAYRQSDATLVIGSYGNNLLVFKLEN